MEILIILAVAVIAFFYLMGMNSKYSPNKPILRKDLKFRSETIDLKEGKKILREFIKDVLTERPSIVAQKLGMRKSELSKRDINEFISGEIENFSDGFKDHLDDLKDQVKDLKKEISEFPDEEDKKELDKLNKEISQKDCSLDLLWYMNDFIGVSRKNNAILVNLNYTKPNE